MKWWWWWGITFANARQEKGLSTKIAKSSRRGSISDAPSETGSEISVGVWCGGVDELVAVVGHCVCKREAGGG
jgi:hypothetical protein